MLLFAGSIVFGVGIQVMVSVVGMRHLQSEPTRTGTSRERIVAMRVREYDLDEDN